MNLTYPEIFALRGRAYHDTMLRFPSARNIEFKTLFDRRPLSARSTVFDIPAGGGYLSRVLPAGTRAIGLELTGDFGGDLPVYRRDEPWPLGSFDRGVCLAALHHIDDQAGFLGSLMRGLSPGGLLHVGDVEARSSIAEFLDDFVGRYNITGHHGTYLSTTAIPAPAGTDVVRAEPRDVPWHFQDEAALVAFCTGLFGLDGCPPAELLRALERHVGIESSGTGLVLRWRLVYADLRRHT